MADITEVAASTIQVSKRSEVSEDIEFADLEELNTDLEIDELVVTLNNTASGKSHKLLFRYPTPGEIAMIEGSFLSSRVLKELTEAKNEKDLSDEAVKDTVTQMSENTLARMMKTLQVCALKPRGITIEVLEGWDPSWIEGIYVELMKKARAATSVDTFPKVDGGSGKRGAGASTTKDSGKES